MKKKKNNGIRQRSPGWGGGACRTPLQDPARQHVVSQPSLLQNGTAVHAAARQTQWTAAWRCGAAANRLHSHGYPTARIPYPQKAEAKAA